MINIVARMMDTQVTASDSYALCGQPRLAGKGSFQKRH